MAPRNAPVTLCPRNSGTASSSPWSRNVRVTPWPFAPVADWRVVLTQIPAPVPYIARFELNGSSASASTQLVAPVPISGPSPSAKVLTRSSDEKTGTRFVPLFETSGPRGVTGIAHGVGSMSVRTRAR